MGSKPVANTHIEVGAQVCRSEPTAAVRRASQRVMVWVVAALWSSGLALAQSGGGTGSGTVLNFTPAVSNGVEFYVLTLSSMSTASCATTGRFALSSSDPKYKTTVAILLGAYFSGTSVFARGLATCTVYGGSEDLAYVCADNGAPC